jgi:hypothetical protein
LNFATVPAFAEKSNHGEIAFSTVQFGVIDGRLRLTQHPSGGRGMTRRARFCRGFGWRCAVLRQLAGLSQREAAEKAGITLDSWRRIEAGSIYCHDGTRRRIMLAFDRTHWLMTGKHEAA